MVPQQAKGSSHNKAMDNFFLLGMGDLISHCVIRMKAI
jgi:hypothetical protein